MAQLERELTTTRARELRSGSENGRAPLISASDLKALAEGTHATMYRFMGAHPTVVDGVQGTRFLVWAPNAREVSVLCDLNGWTHSRNPLRPGEHGLWGGFVPGVKSGDAYKFGIRTHWGELVQKIDPYAFYAEVPPKSASVVWDLSGFEWQDSGWLAKRAAMNPLESPLAVFEIQLGSWRRPRDGRQYYNYRELAHMLVDYVKETGYTHIELMPVTEYPFDGSWGYQATGYFSPTSRFGTPHDFKYFVDYCHRADIGVLIDWVPAHFPSDGHSLGRFDGTCLYEHSDPRQGMHPDWGTLIFNYGRNEVRDFLLSSARFWIDEYHIDGLRVDAVASMLYLDYSRKEGEWIPNAYGGRENLEAIQFLKDMNIMLHADFPGVLSVAEESTAWGGVSRPVYTGGLGFTFKWDMGWMNDTLRYMRLEPVHRKHHQNELSFRMVYAFTENFVLPLSHDEVVHGKRSLLSQMPGDFWQKFANLRLLYAYQYAMPGKKLMFMGGEFGQWHEWNHNEELDWPLLNEHFHSKLRHLVGDLNRLYVEQPALYQADCDPHGFSWIDCNDWQHSVYAFLRQTHDGSDLIVAAFNFTPVPRHDYRLGVPREGFYAEIFNTDADLYGGGNVGNQGGVQSEPAETHGRPPSLRLTLPPLGAVFLRPEPVPPPRKGLTASATATPKPPLR